MAIMTTTPGLHDFTGDNFLLPNRPVKADSNDLGYGQQCKYASRLTTMELLPIVSAIDKVGFASMEIWGGATFDAAMKYCNDDPWERLRLFKALMIRTPARMLLRGSNLVGDHPYPVDIVEKFIELAAKNGVDIFEVYDGLNDTENCKTVFAAIKKSKKKCYADLVFTASPVHTIEKYVEIGKEFMRLGCDAITVNDISGQMDPSTAFRLIRALKDNLKIPVILRGCCSGGMAEIMYWEAIRAGADRIETCFASLAGGSSLPAIESISAALLGSPADTGFDLERLTEIDDMLKSICKNHEDVKASFANCNPDVLRHQISGEVRFDLESQFRSADVSGTLENVLDEIECIRKDLGYPPLVAPFDRMIGDQAVLNIVTGERYEQISKEIAAYVMGVYGKSPDSISEELKKLVSNKAKIDAAMDRINWEKAVKESAQFAFCEEDAMSYALFPEIAEPFLRKRYRLEN